MTTAAKTASKLLVTLKDPTGRKRAQARQQLLMTVGAAAAGSLLALALGTLQRRRRRAEQPAATPQQAPRTARAGTPGGSYRSRHGAGAGAFAGAATGPIPAGPTAQRGASSPSPLDTLATNAQRMQDAGSDEPGFGAHLGFGVGGSIPAARVGESVPTGGGDALDGTVHGRDDLGYAESLVTGAGEAITNSTTPSQNGHGSIH